MGNTCCQTGPTPVMLENFGALTQFQDYENGQLPDSDTLIQEMFQKSQNQIFVDKPVMRHKFENKYFIGDWNEGKPEGKGIFYEPNNILYDGDFKNGLFLGEAKIQFFKKNVTYEGEVENGKAKGRGILKNSEDHYAFDGEWLDSRPVVGKLTFDEHESIEKIELSEFQARNRIYYKDKKQYQGSINPENLQPHGLGKLVFPPSSEKDHYEGNWENGQMHGRGRYVWKDGSIYEGSYENGKKEGFGKFTFANSENHYEGFWKNGKQSGMGVLTTKTGVELKRGIWENGKFQTTLSAEQWESMRNEREDNDIKEEEQHHKKIQEYDEKKKHEEEEIQDMIKEQRKDEKAEDKENLSKLIENKDEEQKKNEDENKNEKEEKKDES